VRLFHWTSKCHLNKILYGVSLDLYAAIYQKRGSNLRFDFDYAVSIATKDLPISFYVLHTCIINLYIKHYYTMLHIHNYISESFFVFHLEL
jgi:hypothetical protein